MAILQRCLHCRRHYWASPKIRHLHRHRPKTTPSHQRQIRSPQHAHLHSRLAPPIQHDLPPADYSGLNQSRVNPNPPLIRNPTCQLARSRVPTTALPSFLQPHWKPKNNLVVKHLRWHHLHPSLQLLLSQVPRLFLRADWEGFHPPRSAQHPYQPRKRPPFHSSHLGKPSWLKPLRWNAHQIQTFPNRPTEWGFSWPNRF